jgi:hypothetical protein
MVGRRFSLMPTAVSSIVAPPTAVSSESCLSDEETFVTSAAAPPAEMSSEESGESDEETNLTLTAALPPPAEMVSEEEWWKGMKWWDEGTKARLVDQFLLKLSEDGIYGEIRMEKLSFGDRWRFKAARNGVERCARMFTADFRFTTLSALCAVMPSTRMFWKTHLCPSHVHLVPYDYDTLAIRAAVSSTAAPPNRGSRMTHPNAVVDYTAAMCAAAVCEAATSADAILEDIEALFLFTVTLLRIVAWNYDTMNKAQLSDARREIDVIIVACPGISEFPATTPAAAGEAAPEHDSKDENLEESQPRATSPYFDYEKAHWENEDMYESDHRSPPPSPLHRSPPPSTVLLPNKRHRLTLPGPTLRPQPTARLTTTRQHPQQIIQHGPRRSRRIQEDNFAKAAAKAAKAAKAAAKAASSAMKAAKAAKAAAKTVELTSDFYEDDALASRWRGRS